MCERFSWIEKNGEVLFLTPYDVFDTKRGQELQKHTPRSEDWHGHGAIRWFYDFHGGADRECTDFSTPKNFPPELAKAIKSGKMWGFGITNQMLMMLSRPARTKCDMVRNAARTKCGMVRNAAWTEYGKVCNAARTEYGKVCNAARTKYDKVRNAAWTEYDKVCNAAFGKLFKKNTNRIKAWR